MAALIARFKMSAASDTSGNVSASVSQDAVPGDMQGDHRSQNAERHHPCMVGRRAALIRPCHKLAGHQLVSICRVTEAE